MKNIKTIWYFMVSLLSLILVLYITNSKDENTLMYVSNLTPVFFSLFASIGIYLAYSSFKIFDFTKFAWLILLIGILLNFIAEGIYGYLEIFSGKDMDNYFPSEADYFWCLAYPFFFGGIAMMIYGYKNSGLSMGKAKIYWLIFLGFLGVTSAITYLLLTPIIKDPELELSSKVFYLFYPTSDIMVSTLSFILIYITSLYGRSKAAQPWMYLCIGFVVFSVSDLVYSYLSYSDGYDPGNMIDFGWFVGYMFIGFAGLYQKNLMDSLKKIK